MTTATSSAFRYAGIAALPVCLALAFVAGETNRKDSFALGQGPQTQTECIAGVSHMVCPNEAEIASNEVPFLGELTVTAPRSEFAASEGESASDRAVSTRAQVKPSPGKLLSVL